MTLRISIRVYSDNVLQSIEQVSVKDSELATLTERYGAKHAAAMAKTPGMIEFEFLDEPDRRYRFARIGTDTRRMRNPTEAFRVPASDKGLKQ